MTRVAKFMGWAVLWFCFAIQVGLVMQGALS